MRELVYTGFVTLDGVLDSPGGAAEGHPSGGWVARHPFVPEAFALKGEELTETTALMFGRRSYAAFGSVWPTSEDHAAYRDLPKYVVSSSLSATDIVDGWGDTVVLRATDDVKRLKAEGDGAIFIHGSAELARRLASSGLIDRYHLLVFPYLLGSGKSLFNRDDADPTRLNLVDSEAYSNGVTKLIYEVSGRA